MRGFCLASSLFFSSSVRLFSLSSAECPIIAVIAAPDQVRGDARNLIKREVAYVGAGDVIAAPDQVRGDARNLTPYGGMVAAFTPPHPFRGTRRGELCSPAKCPIIAVNATPDQVRGDARNLTY